MSVHDNFSAMVVHKGKYMYIVTDEKKTIGNIVYIHYKCHHNINTKQIS